MKLKKGDKIQYTYPGLKLINSAGTATGIFLRKLKKGHVEIIDDQQIKRWIHISQIQQTNN